MFTCLFTLCYQLELFSSTAIDVGEERRLSPCQVARSRLLRRYMKKVRSPLVSRSQDILLTCLSRYCVALSKRRIQVTEGVRSQQLARVFHLRDNRYYFNFVIEHRRRGCPDRWDPMKQTSQRQDRRPTIASRSPHHSPSFTLRSPSEKPSTPPVPCWASTVHYGSSPQYNSRSGSHSGPESIGSGVMKVGSETLPFDVNDEIGTCF